MQSHFDTNLKKKRLIAVQVGAQMALIPKDTMRNEYYSPVMFRNLNRFFKVCSHKNCTLSCPSTKISYWVIINVMTVKKCVNNIKKFDEHWMVRMSIITSIYFVRKTIEKQHLMRRARFILFLTCGTHRFLFFENSEYQNFPLGQLQNKNLWTMSVKCYLEDIL